MREQRSESRTHFISCRMWLELLHYWLNKGIKEDNVYESMLEENITYECYRHKKIKDVNNTEWLPSIVGGFFICFFLYVSSLCALCPAPFFLWKIHEPHTLKSSLLCNCTVPCVQRYVIKVKKKKKGNIYPDKEANILFF